jgi:glycosyltransferase involved in cell wall biosynthesis
MLATTGDKVIFKSTPAAPLRGFSERPISVCLLISSLEYGGAERQVVELVRSFDRNRIIPFACSLSPKVPLATELRRPEEDLCIVEKHGRYDITTIWRVARVLRQRKVDVVHGFLLDAEIVARLAAPLARVPVVVASERNTDYVRPALHRAALRLTQPLFDVMVANSHAGKAFDIRTLALDDSRIVVVPNGVDTERFRPDHAAGLALRRELGIDPGAGVVTMVGSFKRQKGHVSFLQMAARVRSGFPETFFFVVGEPFRDDSAASHDYKAEMIHLAQSLGLHDRCLFLGHRKDMPAVYNASEVTVLLSTREGTPNVVLESMACGVPVVASDVADNRSIVAEGVNGFVVSPQDVEGAAARVQQLLLAPEDRAVFGAAARETAIRDYSLAAATKRLEKIYRSCLARKGVVL